MQTYSTLLASAIAGADSVGLVLDADWLQGRTAYGGWQSGLGLKAMRQVVGPDIPLRSLQSNFIAPVGPGKVMARAELLRRGKSAAQVEARIAIDGQVAFTALGIFGVSRQSVVCEAPAAPPAMMPVEQLQDQPYIEGIVPVFAKNFRIRWGGGAMPLSGAAHSDGQVYVRFRDEDVIDDVHLVCLADALPPSAYSMLRTPAPLSSMNWTLEFVSPPTDSERRGWFRFDCGLSAAGDGYGWENTRIWSDQGRLIALSRQCVALFG